VSATKGATRLTLEEIEAQISEIALNGEGPDKFRALALLRKEKPVSALGVVPEPATDEEKIEVLSHLHQASGPLGVRLAWQGLSRGIRRALTDR